MAQEVFGSQLRKLMMARFSLDSWARVLHVSKIQIQGWWVGKHFPAPHLAQKIYKTVSGATPRDTETLDAFDVLLDQEISAITPEKSDDPVDWYNKVRSMTLHQYLNMVIFSSEARELRRLQEQ